MLTYSISTDLGNHFEENLETSKLAQQLINTAHIQAAGR